VRAKNGRSLWREGGSEQEEIASRAIGIRRKETENNEIKRKQKKKRKNERLLTGGASEQEEVTKLSAENQTKNKHMRSKDMHFRASGGF